ncbi:MAG: thioredoxin domain-containing protein [Candidatus Scalindua sp. AMX11]|nr:MAG: thioredoxin domain-containing protein [Candidatus Scalindua sp.]NOG85319.1 thioredoxin domain-containing protein [Planctomycetota bacterium]RZV81527.1 MAG: thioredoxin domain-containing protein [Candidatus Scalindua sp. SCAELEC01]TDE65493.1 MAG: thioredoxin domain-containing protein [Candidatus Scalindua sp. AMX11]
MDQQHTGKEVKTHQNRLIHEKSPYLLQHAENPVDWYAWGPEAFEKAKKENKPIFLSIGYSTCHWCHVMAHESFEDPEVARLMNEVFVCIKVDREERPDIDNIYMAVCQMMTRSGGWPLTIFMTPDKKPFFAGTYIPKESRFGRAGLVELIPKINEVWQTRHDEILETADKITANLTQPSTGPTGPKLDETTLKTAYEQLSGRFDEQLGGFGTAPKFPTSQNFLFLLRYWQRTGDDKALRMVERSLKSMRNGGIYDHIGFGFHRYSTDPHWLVPHFEKMLYDQALLAIAFTETYQATGKVEYGDTAQEIFTYILRDMTDKGGGFYSAEDADSEGVEGKFYLWTEDEIRQTLSKEDADLIITLFNVKKEGNFKDEATGEKTDANIPHLDKPLTETAFKMEISVEELKTRMNGARKQLFTARKQRVHPHKDDKILTDWNGLMIAALAKGAQVFHNQKFLDAAKRATDFILKEMHREDGRLLHRYRDGQSAILAHVDDYAFLIWGLLEVYEATFDTHYLKTALDLNSEMIQNFWDEKGGGFFFTADDAEDLIVRQKEIYDGAIPSANSVSLLNLLRLGRITANPELETKAMKIAETFASDVSGYPSGYTQFLVSLDFGIGPSYEIVIVGDPQASDTEEMLATLRKHFVPNKVVLLKPNNQESPDIVRFAKYLEHHSSIDNKATAYVCLNYACKMPTTDTKEMLSLLPAPSQK